MHPGGMASKHARMSHNGLSAFRCRLLARVRAEARCSRSFTIAPRRIKPTESDGECIISQPGGIGVNGSFGDITQARTPGNPFFPHSPNFLCALSRLPSLFL